MRAPERIARFSGSERTLHWLLAVTFVVMLASGLALYFPQLSTLVARPVASQWHINAALALATGVGALLIAHWMRMRATLRELDRFDRDDVRWITSWLRPWRRRAPPQGRFNAGQKLNSALIAGLMAVLFLTGLLLWLSERNTRFRMPGTVIVHDWAGWLMTLLVLAHLYLALINPATRPALRGIVLGSVRRDWAREHHAKWVAAEERGEGTEAPR